MKILEGFPFLAIATAIYISSTVAAPLDNENDKLVEDEPEIPVMDLPVIRYFTDGMSKYIQDIKEIIASPRPLETAIEKIKQILPKNLEVSIENDVDELNFPNAPGRNIPKIIGFTIEKASDENTPEVARDPPKSLGKPEEKPPQKFVVMGEDPNQPYEEVFDWALKKLGLADTDEKTRAIMDDPVLRYENEPEFKITDDGTNTIVEKVEETDLPSPKLETIFNADAIRDYENQDLQWMQ